MKTANDWNPNLYLKFDQERSRPSRDLVSQIDLEKPNRILDAGCGPGNGTPGLLGRWPGATLEGIDTSGAMITEARKTYPDHSWTVGDVRTLDTDQRWDLIFSNAVLQWVPDHGKTLDGWLRALSPGGAVAVQVPQYYLMPVSAVLEKVFQEVDQGGSGFQFHQVFTNPPAEFYDELLRPKVRRFDLWETTYYHVMDSPVAIIEMLRSTGIKPYLDHLGEGPKKVAFEEQALARIKELHRPQSDGKVLFPFRRLFFVAYL